MAAKSSDWRPGPTVCRCCLTEGCYKDISTEYFWMGKREVYSEMLLETFDLTVAYAQTGGPNSNSRLICEPCISRLRDACDFKRQVVECERVFHQHLAGGSDDIEGSSETVLRSLLEKDVKQEMGTVKVEIEAKMSDDEDFGDHGASPPDDDDDDLDDQPLTKLATKVPKKETVDLMDLMDNAKPEKRKSTTKVKTTPSKKVKKKETPKPSASKAVKPPAEKKKKDVFRWDLADAAARNAALILRNSTAYPFYINTQDIECCFCDAQFTEPSLFRIHFQIIHPSVDASYIVDEDDNMFRVDISELQCKRCTNSEMFQSLDAIVVHLNVEHDVGIDTNQEFGLAPMKLCEDCYVCVVCNEKFLKLLTYYKHMLKHMSRHTVKHVCDVCEKCFENKESFRNHKRFCPVSRKCFCSFCRKYFRSPEEKRAHQELNYLCMPYKCRDCKMGFSFYEPQQKHLVEVHGKQKPVHKCAECHKIFRSRILLYCHFNQMHTDNYLCKQCNKRFTCNSRFQDHKNSHSEIKPFQCDLCGKGFNTKKSLNQHLITHDDSKKLPCPQCDRLFVTNIRLRRHLQTRHPINT